MKKYIIIPGCSDLNRGDQALVWETKRLAEECGFKGAFYLTSECNEPTEQSERKGLYIISPVLEHPSRFFKNKENMQYTRSLKLKWGVVALGDTFISLLLLWKPTRKLITPLLSAKRRKTISLFENADGIFMKGGGLLQTYGGITATYSMYFWTYPLFLAHRMGKPVYVMPNSFGPFEGPLVKNIAKAALKPCKVVTSRETISQRMVEEQLKLKIRNYPDLAFLLPKANVKEEAIRKQYNLPMDRKLVAITMRPYRFPSVSNPEAAYSFFKQEMGKFIQWLYNNGYMPVIVEHTLAINAHENDGACIMDVIQKLNKNEYCIISNKDLDCMQLKTIYGMCDYIVGTRFHSMIFAFGNGVPGIAIAYTGNKSQGIMHDMGLDNYVVMISDVSQDILSKKFSRLIEEEREVKNKISEYLSKCESARQELISMCSEN